MDPGVRDVASSTTDPPQQQRANEAVQRSEGHEGARDALLGPLDDRVGGQHLGDVGDADQEDDDAEQPQLESPRSQRNTHGVDAGEVDGPQGAGYEEGQDEEDRPRYVVEAAQCEHEAEEGLADDDDDQLAHAFGQVLGLDEVHAT